MRPMDRVLPAESVNGEIGLVIDYAPGVSRALDVLGGAMALVIAIDELDAALLSSISSELEPVSVLNDVQHSSLRMLLARVLRSVPDEHIASLDWKKWVGGLLVKGKHLLLQVAHADAPVIEATLKELEPEYRAAPGGLIGYEAPSVKAVQAALGSVNQARAQLPGQRVVVQTDLGDVELVEAPLPEPATPPVVDATIVNKGREYLKVRAPDMVGQAQWTVIRNGRNTRVDVLHKSWLEQYHARRFTLLPGDSLDCSFEETVSYDAERNEVGRSLSIIEVHGVISPPHQEQGKLPLHG